MIRMALIPLALMVGHCAPHHDPAPACAAGATVMVVDEATPRCDLGAGNTLVVLHPGLDGDDPVVCDSGQPVVVVLPGEASATAGCWGVDF